MRPKGSLDSKKRKVKKFLTSKQERKIIEQYEGGSSLGQLAKLYGISKSCISSLFKKRKVKSRVTHAHVCAWVKVEDIKKIKNNICGIYGIYFVNKKNNNDIKLYIGSSTNIRSRLSEHYRLLNSKTHYSKLVQQYFDSNKYSCNYAILKECDEKNLMQEEVFFQYEYNRSCLLNSWLSTNGSDLFPWLQKAITLKSYMDYEETPTGCWESKNTDKKGYGVLSVVAFRDWGPGKVKYFYTHRVAYWERYGEYPALIRHKCNNRKCRNPDHLIKGNYKDNALDKRGDFPEIFTRKWREFEGDVVKLTKYFGWKSNCSLKNARVSTSVYGWEKKLNLRNKYPEILNNNPNRKNVGVKR